jgi:hypothetical protein
MNKYQLSLKKLAPRRQLVVQFFNNIYNEMFYNISNLHLTLLRFYSAHLIQYKLPKFRNEKRPATHFNKRYLRRLSSDLYLTGLHYLGILEWGQD